MYKVLKIFITVICVCSIFLGGCSNVKKPSDNTGSSKENISSEENISSVDNVLSEDNASSEDNTSSEQEDISTNTELEWISDNDNMDNQSEAIKDLITGEIDFKLQPLPGSMSSELLKNPDRGFRLETYLTLDGERAYPSSNQSAYEFFDNLYYDYFEDGAQLTQAFIYITNYYKKDLDQKAFDKINKYFDFMREKNIRLLVRFAYQWDENDRVTGPTAQQVIRHIQQLKPIMEKNADVVHCWQAGFIGNWAEWHNFVVPISDEEKAQILQELVAAAPGNMYIQTRMVEYRELLSDYDPAKMRIGFHDDYLTGFPQHWSCGLTPDTADYNKMIDASSYVLVDGEMPWGDDKYMGEKFNGLDMAEYLGKRHFTSMSLIHNYRDAGLCSMSYWKEQRVGEKALRAKGLNVAPGWFQTETGAATEKTIFDYIQQYLGYYIVASDAKATSTADTVNASITFTNYGFAAPLGMDKLELVLLDSNGKIVISEDAGMMLDFQPGEKVTLETEFYLPSSDEKYFLGVRFVNSAGTGARLANMIKFENNINILGRVR